MKPTPSRVNLSVALSFMAVPQLLSAQGRSDVIFAHPSIESDYSTTVTGLGDVNGDSVPDYAAGSPKAGVVRIYSGTDGSLLNELKGAPPFGARVRSIGDMDYDGTPDVLIGSPSSPAGQVFVYSGRTWQLVHTLTGATSSFGLELRRAGDVDRDGAEDVIVGESAYDPGSGSSDGRVQVFSGAIGAPIHTVVGVTWDRLGLHVDGAGDWDGDGYADFAASGLGRSPSNTFGFVKVFSGRSGAVIWSKYTGANEIAIGGGMRAGADLDGDGVGDVVFLVVPSATSVAFQAYSGRTRSRIFSSGIVSCNPSCSNTDFVLGFPGDFNGDGVTELGIMSNSDYVLILALRGQRFARQILRRGLTSSGAVGWRRHHEFDGLGDVNGDGVPDIVVGGYSETVSNTGELRVYSVTEELLISNPQAIPRAIGGTQTLETLAGIGRVGQPFMIVGSVTGTTPGTRVGTLRVPLNVDPYTNFTISAPTPSFVGVLDARGRATSTLPVPAGLTQTFSVHHACLVLRAGMIEWSSNATSLRIE